MLLHLQPPSFTNVHHSAEDFPAAANEFETILRSNPNVIEALVSLASIHTHGYFTSHPDAGEATAGDRRIAKENYDRVLRLFSSNSAAVASGSGSRSRHGQSERIAEQERDWQLFVEIAQLCASEPSLDAPLKAYGDAYKVFVESEEPTESGKNISSLLLNNIGVLEYHKGFFESAKDRFLGALEEMSKKVARGFEPDLVHDAVVTGLMYNFGVVHEALGDREVAKSTYESILEKHPEFVDGQFPSFFASSLFNFSIKLTFLHPQRKPILPSSDSRQATTKRRKTPTPSSKRL